MKRIHSIICAATCLLLGGLSSCSDFLVIEPQNEIILEKFWNEKADVDGVVASCYAKMQSEPVIKRMMVWGEFRSENVSTGSNIDKDLDLGRIFRDNITASNGYTTWVDFYYIINTCNTVIKYAPTVAAKDPGYTETELKATIAEVSALRDLCYFYLIRTFCDVPYSTEAFTDDDQRMDLPASSFDDILDWLIADLENVKDNAVTSYAATNDRDRFNKTGRITRDAINAMLCEMYLWKKDYQNCIKYADIIIDHKKQIAEEQLNNGNRVQDDGRLNGFPLTANSWRNSTEFGYAYTDIFGSGNSDESIFELVFIDDNSMPSNAAVTNFYGVSLLPGFAAPSMAVAEQGNSIAFTNKYDTRYYDYMFGTLPSDGKSAIYSINKYKGEFTYVYLPSLSNISIYFSTYPDKRNKSNWIIYRLADIMLMKAEALTQLVEDVPDTDDGGNAEIVESNTKLLNEAFYIVNAINKRSIGQTILRDTLLRSDYTTKSQMEDLVMDERQRELMFEGKRWYDLVRYSRRSGNTQYLSTNATAKYSSDKAIVQNKLTKMTAIYWPYNREELKVNKNLHQNPSFSSGDSGNHDIAK